MLTQHRGIPKWIKKKYSGQFNVLAEGKGSTNYLPDKDRHWYQPDVVLKSLTEPNDIRYIIEVECDPVRKALVGACLLADCSLKAMQDAKAGLIFIVYSKKGKKQINDFKAKVELIRNRLPHLSSIQVMTDEDFKHGKVFGLRSTTRKDGRKEPELHAYQDALVRKGLEEMRSGRVVSHEKVVKRLKRSGAASSNLRSSAS